MQKDPILRVLSLAVDVYYYFFFRLRESPPSEKHKHCQLKNLKNPVCLELLVLAVKGGFIYYVRSNGGEGGLVNF